MHQPRSTCPPHPQTWSLIVNNRQLARVALGLLGIWGLLTAVAEFIQIAAVIGASATPVALAVVVPAAALLGLSYLLIFHNARVAMAMFPESEAAAEPLPADLARTLIALTGVVLVVQASPGAVNNILNLFIMGATESSLRAPLLRRLISSAVPIGAGWYLIARPGRLLEYLQRPLPELAADAG
jgi:hypothetical protein